MDVGRWNRIEQEGKRESSRNGMKTGYLTTCSSGPSDLMVAHFPEQGAHNRVIILIWDMAQKKNDPRIMTPGNKWKLVALL